MKIFAAANINVAKFLSNSYLLIFLKAFPFPMVPLFPPKIFPPISYFTIIFNQTDGPGGFNRYLSIYQ